MRKKIVLFCGLMLSFIFTATKVSASESPTPNLPAQQEQSLEELKRFYLSYSRNHLKNPDYRKFAQDLAEKNQSSIEELEEVAFTSMMVANRKDWRIYCESLSELPGSFLNELADNFLLMEKASANATAKDLDDRAKNLETGHIDLLPEVHQELLESAKDVNGIDCSALAKRAFIASFRSVAALKRKTEELKMMQKALEGLLKKLQEEE